MKTVRTPKGTELPLTNLKGKDYLMVAYRLQWFNETEKKFLVDTEFLVLTDEQTIAKATVTVLGEDGNALRRATATKRETKKDFSDHTEKAETSAIGRALAMLGYGTQFALADLDEGERLADSPVVAVTKIASSVPKTTTVPVTVVNNKAEVMVTADSPTSAVSPATNTFKKPRAAKPAPKVEVQTAESDGWE
jgi:hypothetical protein